MSTTGSDGLMLLQIHSFIRNIMSWVAASVVRRLHINQSWDMSWEEGILRENNNTQHTIQHDVW